MKPFKSLKHTLLINWIRNNIINGARWWDHIKGLCCHCFPAGRRSDEHIPDDVPKGHLAMYVGEGEGEGGVRYVVDISVLGHPLFQALLDQAAEVFEFSAAAQLRIPCSEAVFLGILSLICSQSVLHGGCCLSVVGKKILEKLLKGLGGRRCRVMKIQDYDEDVGNLSVRDLLYYLREDKMYSTTCAKRGSMIDPTLPRKPFGGHLSRVLSCMAIDLTEGNGLMERDLCSYRRPLRMTTALILTSEVAGILKEH
ncbi:hypothetical protein CRG98_032863 [Punica granatum]|uniref:Uncharacterized protein n=1 Tax=Punica granatum TaxID=22663 RepID=A0A2I0ISN4_PUNGR|nr:hypothetical protein CRG98_032863 [Punica granatum]